MSAGVKCIKNSAFDKTVSVDVVAGRPLVSVYSMEGGIILEYSNKEMAVGITGLVLWWRKLVWSMVQDGLFWKGLDKYLVSREVLFIIQLYLKRSL